MKTSIALLEVFSAVQNHVDFPNEFIQLFIKNCMDQCSNNNNTAGGKSVHKNRQVRIVIVFL